MESVSKLGFGERLLAYLRERREDRGVMANLRSGLVERQHRRSWPLLAAFNGIGDHHAARVVRTVAGLYATHPKESASGDFGTTCRALLGDEERQKLADGGEPGPVSKRFLHLLAAEGNEIFDRVASLGLRAKAHNDGIPIHYERLFADLWTWESQPDRVRERWARSFWAPRSKEDAA